MKKISAAMLIFFIALFFRLYRLDDLAKFGSDEARDSLIEREMILSKKLTLLGPETRIGNHIVYYGPFHYYLMAPVLALSNFNPMGPYVWTAILGSVTAILIYVLTSNVFAGLFYAVLPIAIIFNRWAWNPNTIPLFATLFLLALLKKRIFLAGLFLGLAIQLHPTSVILGVFLISKLKKLSNFLPLLLGLALGLLPIIVFELRHQFIYLNSFLALRRNDFQSRSFSWHYFLWLTPLLAVYVARLPKKITMATVFICAIVSVKWLVSQKPEKLQNPRTIEAVANLIAGDIRETKLFNVSSFVTTEARATPIRFFLARQNIPVLGVSDYFIADYLYVLTFDEKSEVIYNQTYEISAFQPKKVTRSWNIENAHLFRLEK